MCLNIFYRKINKGSICDLVANTIELSLPELEIVSHTIKYLSFPSDSYNLNYKIQSIDYDSHGKVCYIHIPGHKHIDFISKLNNKILYPKSLLVNCGTMAYAKNTKFYLIIDGVFVHIIAINIVCNTVINTACTQDGYIIGTISEYHINNLTVRKVI